MFLRPMIVFIGQGILEVTGKNHTITLVWMVNTLMQGQFFFLIFKMKEISFQLRLHTEESQYTYNTATSLTNKVTRHNIKTIIVFSVFIVLALVATTLRWLVGEYDQHNHRKRIITIFLGIWDLFGLSFSIYLIFYFFHTTI